MSEHAAFDLEQEQAIDFATAAAESPGRPNLSTIWRWAIHGVRGPGSARIRLEWFAQGRRRYTTREALSRFRERCTHAAAGDQDPAQVSSPARRKQIEAAERKLREAGV